MYHRSYLLWPTVLGNSNLGSHSGSLSRPPPPTPTASSSPFTRLAVTVLRAWCKQCLPGRWKPDAHRPGVVWVRGSFVIRLWPCMTSSIPPPLLGDGWWPQPGTQEGDTTSRKCLCTIRKQRNERPTVGSVSIRSRNGAPTRKGCVVNGQMTKTSNK